MPSIFSKLYARIYQAVNWRLRYYWKGRWAGYCRPVSMALLLTERCNARCVHCDIWKNRGQEDRPTLQQWKKVLFDLRHWLGPVPVTLTGGEALLVPFATDLVAYGSSLGLLMEHLTHGFWRDQTHIEKLVRARPWRVTVSLDGIGETHAKIRGRKNFFALVTETLSTLQRGRRETGKSFEILLKTVIMEHNLQGLGDVANFAKKQGFNVFFQPIEQNYNTKEDPRWFETSPNWPKDPRKAVQAIQGLIAMKEQGYPITNSRGQLEVMIPYFEDPQALRVITQHHQAHDLPLCSALTTFQIQPNGDVRTCFRMDPVGNIKIAPIRKIWEQRPRFWERGCCLQNRQVDTAPSPDAPTTGP